MLSVQWGLIVWFWFGLCVGWWLRFEFGLDMSELQMGEFVLFLLLITADFHFLLLVLGLGAGFGIGLLQGVIRSCFFVLHLLVNLILWSLYLMDGGNLLIGVVLVAEEKIIKHSHHDK